MDGIGYSSSDQLYDQMGMTDQKLKEAADQLGMPLRTIYKTPECHDAYYSMMTRGNSASIQVIEKIGNIVFSA